MRLVASIVVLAAGAAGLYWLATAESGGMSTPVRAEVVQRAHEPPRFFEALTRAGPQAIRFDQRRTPILGFREYPYPFLVDEDPTASVSLGTVTEGQLINAAEMTLPGDHYRILPRQLLRNLRYTSDEMAELVRQAADRVAEEYPDAVLWLGNFGRRGGGDIPWSVSHNSGRDADLAFYYVDSEGFSVAPPDLVPVARNLTATWEGQTYTFDVARNWALVRGLLDQDEAQIQFLFIANYLKQALLQHARELGEPRGLVSRAEAVLTQPGRANPHHDHLHVRLYCSQDDVGGGCINTGRIHSWVDTHADARTRRIREVRRFLEDDSPEQRARAIERLVILESRDDVDRVAERLGDEAARVRAAAATALAQMGDRHVVPALVEACEREDEGQVVDSILKSLGRIGGPGARDHLLSHLDESYMVALNGRTVDVRALAIDALAQMEAVQAAPRFVELLASDDAYVRARASWGLERLSNRRFGGDWADPELDRMSRREGIEAWRAWMAEHGDEPRESWLVAGFATQGYTVLDEGVDLTALSVAVQSDRPFVRFNAQRALMNLLDREVPSLTWPAGDAAWYWREATRPR